MPRALDLGRLRVFSADRQATIAVGLVALIVVCVLLAFYGTTASMAAIWRRSETYAHGFLVIPMFLWLVWRERRVLATIEPRPSLVALAGLVVAAALAWLGERLNTISVPQFAMMAMIPLAIGSLMGLRVLRALAFPFVLLFFAVPFGEFMVPRLIDWTADFTVFAIRLSGVPIYREGNMFAIPSGMWSVVEACSGLRYLIASVMIGVLFAYLSYRSPRRRALFIAASIIVPLIANWMRAYGIVMIGHLSGNRLAVGVDHLIYGWIFFGLVMLVLFAIGSRWREDAPADGAGTAAASSAAPVASRWTAPRWPAIVAVALVVAVGGVVTAAAHRDGEAAQVALGAPPRLADWQPAPDFSRWRPAISAGSGKLHEVYARDGRRVGLDVTLFVDQTRDSKAISSANQLTDAVGYRFVETSSSHQSIDVGPATVVARQVVVTGEGQSVGVLQWYWVDGHVTGSALTALAWQALAVARGRGDAVAWVVVSTPLEPDPATALEAQRAFARAVTGPLDARLHEALDRP